MTFARTYYEHFTMAQNLELCLRLVVAFVVGGLIGLERSNRFKEAGVRTHIMVCCTTALIMLISKYGFADLGPADTMEYFGSKGADTARIAAQAVSGISFLCAGVIIKVGGNIKGLTTAAGIWMTACIGLAVGAGMYLISIIATLLIIFILVNIERLEQRHNFMWESKIIRVKVHGIIQDIQPLRDIIVGNDVHISDEFMKFDYGNQVTIVNFMIRSKSNVDVPAMFNAIKEHSDPISITITNEMSM